MNKTIVAAALFVISVQIAPAWATGPGFDCAEASLPVEHTICQSERLSRQDAKLSRLYRNLMKSAAQDSKRGIRARQQEWLLYRNKACDLTPSEAENCLLEIYRARNRELSAQVVEASARAQPASESETTDDSLAIVRVTPAGNNVEAGQQIVFQFDREVVPIGKMERDANEIPVVISPVLNCEWRWLNTSALACQLRNEDRMKPATTYRLSMSPGIQTEDGRQLSGEYRHRFTTLRPKVTYTRFVNWLSPGTPLIQVSFNQPVTRSSVELSMTMTPKSASSSQAVGVIAYADNMKRTLPWWMALTNDNEQPRVDDQLARLDGDEARRVWVVEPRAELPLDSSVGLDIEPGLVSSSGDAIGIESRTVVKFNTYPDFSFVGIYCRIKGKSSSEEITLARLQNIDPGASIFERCAPLEQVGLLFSAPVKNSTVKNHVQFTPRLDGGRTDYDPWENTHDWTQLSRPHRRGSHYRVWLPELLKAYQKYSVKIDTESFSDEFGRRLDNPVSFDFYTGHREPDLRINHNNAVLEKGVDSDVPVYLTNLEQATITYDKLGDSSKGNRIEHDIEVQQVEDVAYATPLGVRQLLGDDDTGVIYGRLHPDPLPPDWYRDPEVLAQVTPYQVHFKAGHFNSQAWVTRFADGIPVRGARVSLHRGARDSITSLVGLGIEATTDADGLALLPGLEQIDPELEYINSYRPHDQGFFARVEYDGDIALLPLNYYYEIDGVGTYSWLRPKGGHTHAWGTTAQGIYKLGDRIQFKIYVRDQSNRHWVSPSRSAYRLQVVDPQDKVVYEQKNIVLSDFGAFDGEFKVAEQGAVGWYRFKLTPEKATNNKRDGREWLPMSVLVTDFTPSPFKVKTELNGELFRANDRVEVTSLATLHSGGPFTDAEIRLTARLKTRDFSTDNPLASGFSFGGSKGQRLSQEQRNLLDVRGKLSDAGEYENAFTLKDADIYFGRLMVESAVKDDRGKFVASSSAADYAGRDRFVGLKNTRWLYKKGEPARLETLVVDQQGELVAGSDIRIDIFHREYKASRVKGPGNAYLTKNIMQWVEQGSCELKSETDAVICEFEPQSPGYYQFVATTRDSRNREHKTTLNGWATGSGSVIWDQTDDATLQIIPEQTEYQIGDTARYLVKNPFPGARALVTVERYGVLDSWIEVLETGTPVIEVPIKPDYLPGFYLSVVAMSPRVAKPLSAENVDLGKPSFRMGYVSAEVSDPYKRIDIDVVTDKAVYKPRERVRADIQLGLEHAQGGENYEIAIAVVDESVLALNSSGARYYDPYAGFNRLDSLDVNNYSLISRLVGRQKFEKKGANPGGGGSGSSKLRNLFKFVSYWNPSINPDANGRAQVEFEVPDNLTGWRVLALAVTEDDEMGLGDANFKVNRPTEIRPVMPNQVIEGDSFSAGFSVMNRTGQPRKLKVDVRLQGPLAPGQATDFSYQLEIAAFKRENVWIPVNTRGAGELSFAIDGSDALDGDALEHRLPVNKRRSLETAATYGSTTEELSQVSVRVPDGIHSDVGYIGAVLSPSVIGNVDGAMRYLRDYPYLCWEQRLTRAITANSYIELKDYLHEDTEWPTPEQDIVRELEAAANFQAPNGGMTYWVASNQYVSPYLSAYTAIGFNWLRSSGYRIPTAVEDRLHDYLLNLLRRDAFPSFYSKGMASSVRAVALAALAESGRIDRSDIDRYRSHLPEMDLFGQSHFLLAAAKIEGVGNDTLKAALDSILGHASQSGGKFQFNEAWDDSYKYLLATPLRSNCSILSSLLTLQAESDLNRQVGDIPFKMVRSITQSRGNREHWENTQENVFCMNALIDYARVYEATEPAMEVKLRFDGEDLGATRFNSRAEPMVTVKRDLRESDEGLAAKLEIERKGQGRLYYSARIAYDLKQDNASRINSGIELRREYSVERDGKFVLLESPFEVKRGEVVKVDLFVSVPTARHFVVVNDPIPGGLEPVNTDLAAASQVDAEKGDFKAAEESYFYQFSNWTYFGRYFWSFYHKELRHDSARFYADYLPAGNYHLSYAAQVIAEGDFTVMPTHAEEMYDPDIYGKGLPARLEAAGQ